jgi:SAM-dependent methyltransferase
MSPTAAASGAATVRRIDESAVCPSCGITGLDVFFEQDGVPVHSCRLLPTRDEALAFPRGTIRLAFCRACGFITNTAYDVSLQDYGLSYEETQGFSERFRGFARALAERWVERYGLAGKDVVEIGCGKGEFLLLLCELGARSGLGIDPSVVEERVTGIAADRVTFLKELYGPRHADLPADAVVCRHTLEHIEPVGELVELVREAVGRRPGSVALFELPDVGRVLRECAFWDVYYEHCSYFSPGSLARLFRRNRFDVVELELDYDDQYILLGARAGEGRSLAPELEEPVERLADDVETFRSRFAATASAWREYLDASRRDGRTVVVWGAGSKGVAFLTTLGVGDHVACAVDINPYKDGMFVAATGHRIVLPEELTEIRPDAVVVMNPVYLDEIGETLTSLGLSCDLLAV